MSARLNLMISGTFRPCKKGKQCIAVPSRRSCRTMGRAQASKVARPPMNHLQSPAPQNSTAEAPGMDRCYLQSSRLEGYLCSLTNPYGTLSPSDLAWKGCVTKVDGL
ncbi:hypothetical protein HZ326_31833 [Fusarium oxysporum f. sp. albedinis]|nr:hypothetical protein HZ326_31833 [Fusarium oxysporum f. sp. albedinis]